MAEIENKLYPPYVDPSIPAQVLPNKSTSETTTVLKVPFQMNKAVSWIDLGDAREVSLIFKTVSTGKVILDGFKGKVVTQDTTTGTPIARFEIPKTTFLPTNGQYYKIQIAFVSASGQIGYYSDVTVAKFIEKPEVGIEGLTSDVNTVKYSYTGTYKSTDVSEKVLYYEFVIEDTETGLVHDTSGKLLHNSNTDVARNQSSDTWTSYKTLKNERLYTINYIVYTINGLTIESGAYQIMALETLDLVSRNTEFIATLHPDDAYVHIHILPKDYDADIKAITGNFILARASSEDNFSSWREIYKFTLTNNYPMMTLWKDFTVQQGYSYKYAVQAYNAKGVYSNRLECKYYSTEADERNDDANRQMWNAAAKDPMENTTLNWHYLQEIDGTPTTTGLPVDFEDAFLYDGLRQLKIRYNPKVSSFKTTLLEAKLDTIGGKYPFIFRNGNVEYKEFPISGLITMLMDENSLFVDNIQYENTPRLETIMPPYDDAEVNSKTGRTKRQSRALQERAVTGSSTALTASNFRKEREFKMEVLKWLNNGEPKLFRSPSEGNFIVRLMNTSLTPNDQLSRMLHTFNSTAYEIADCNFENLSKYNFINALQTSYQELKFKMLDAELTFRNQQNKQITIDNGAYYLAIIDQYGYWALRITYKDGSSTVLNSGNATGQYLFDKDALKSNPITSITYMEGAPDPTAKILYGYYELTEMSFSLISHITRKTVIEQIIGHPDTTYRLDSININYIDAIKNGIGRRSNQKQSVYGYDNIPRQTLGKFYYLKAEPREITDIFLKSGKYYYNERCDHEIFEWDDTAIYAVYTWNNNAWELVNQYSGRPANSILLNNPSYLLKLNAKPNNGIDPAQEEVVDLSLKGGSGGNAPITTGRYELYFDLDTVESLYIGSGVVCEICYNINTIHYEAENKSQYVGLHGAKAAWEEKQANYDTLLRYGNSIHSIKVEQARLEAESSYHTYLSQLQQVIEELEKEGDTYYAL